MRIMIVTDAWFPQTNGVVSTLAQTAAWLGRFGHEVRIITSSRFPQRRLPDLSGNPPVDSSLPEDCNAAFLPTRRRRCTSRPKGRSASAARRFCLRHGMRFTTSYHTQFPQYLRARFPMPLSVSYRALRWFHGAARALHGEHRLGAPRSRNARVQEPGGLAPRRRHRDIQASPERIFSRCRARSPPMSAASPSKRISMHSCKCTGPAPRS